METAVYGVAVGFILGSAGFAHKEGAIFEPMAKWGAYTLFVIFMAFMVWDRAVQETIKKLPDSLKYDQLVMLRTALNSASINDVVEYTMVGLILYINILRIYAWSLIQLRKSNELKE